MVGGAHVVFHVVTGTAYVWAVPLFPDGRIPMPSRAGARRLLSLVAVCGTGLMAVVCFESSI